MALNDYKLFKPTNQIYFISCQYKHSAKLETFDKKKTSKFLKYELEL